MAEIGPAHEIPASQVTVIEPETGRVLHRILLESCAGREPCLPPRLEIEVRRVVAHLGRDAYSLNIEYLLRRIAGVRGYTSGVVADEDLKLVIEEIRATARTCLPPPGERNLLLRQLRLQLGGFAGVQDLGADLRAVLDAARAEAEPARAQSLLLSALDSLPSSLLEGNVACEDRLATLQAAARWILERPPAAPLAEWPTFLAAYATQVTEASSRCPLPEGGIDLDIERAIDRLAPYASSDPMPLALYLGWIGAQDRIGTFVAPIETVPERLALRLDGLEKSAARAWREEARQ